MPLIKIIEQKLNGVELTRLGRTRVKKGRWALNKSKKPIKALNPRNKKCVSQNKKQNKAEQNLRQ